MMIRPDSVLVLDAPMRTFPLPLSVQHAPCQTTPPRMQLLIVKRSALLSIEEYRELSPSFKNRRVHGP